MSSTPLRGALGSIEPDATELSTLLSRLDILETHPEWVLVEVDATTHPQACMDGRPQAPINIHEANSGALPPVRMAGATLATWVTDLLVTCSFAPPPDVVGIPSPVSSDDAAGMSVLQATPDANALRNIAPTWLSLMCSTLRERGIDVATHSDTHAHGSGCGCGAADNLSSILALIAQMPSGLEETLRQWGVDPAHIDDSVRRRCAEFAATVPSGASISGILNGYCSTPAPTLVGDHREVTVVVNLRPSTAVDSQAVGRWLATGSFDAIGTEELEYTAAPTDDQAVDPHQILCIDAWACDVVADFLCTHQPGPASPTAELPREDLRERASSVAAAVNAATLMVLAGPHLPMAILR
ncbi:hypothetical protein [Schaalia suimastitidis]|uniref:hypothetical protein n=1 Tax=Schaalia suimastitidis TaxID=121163 RepID=UPI00040A8689|nr:hypothetical protein [Schaalia suimastitidis]